MENKKCLILDYSFYIYNYSYSMKFPCSNSTLNDNKRPVCSCDRCDNGFIYMNHNGVRTGGLYGVFCNIIPKLSQGYEIILAFDPPKESLERTKLLDNYKGNRAETPDWIEYQMDWGEKYFPYFKNIKCYTSENEESDDIMATIAIEKANSGYSVIVASDDKDMYPLLDNKNIILYRQKNIFTKKDFIDKFGFEPKRFSEYLAITGDAADNYNLIKGLGDKAAKDIISKFDHINNIWGNWDLLDEKYKKKLVNNCIGNTCKKCKKCNNYNNRNDKTYKLKDELQLSLDLAFLNTKCNYFNINKEPNKDLVLLKLNELKLKNPIENIDLFFN